MSLIEENIMYQTDQMEQIQTDQMEQIQTDQMQTDQMEQIQTDQMQTEQIDEINYKKGNMTKKMIDIIESFMANNEPKDTFKPFSPKLFFLFEMVYDQMKTAPNFTYEIIGADGYTSLAMYKNKNGVYFFSVYFDEIKSYCKLF